MALSDIAAGVEVTTEQCERGVAVVDATRTTLASRLEPFADEFPCDSATAATLAEARVQRCETITESAHGAGVTPITAAKVLYRLGEPVVGLEPSTTEALERWSEANCSRADALATTENRATFAFAAYVATHDPIPGASRVIAEAFSGRKQ